MEGGWKNAISVHNGGKGEICSLIKTINRILKHNSSNNRLQSKLD